MNFALGLLVLLSSASSALAKSPAPFFLRDGDSVAMLGDSITEMAGYTNSFEMWLITRFPHWKLKFRNVGLGSDRAPGGDSRFGSHVLPLKPTVLTVSFGMNDGEYGPFNSLYFQRFMDGLRGIAKQAAAVSLRTIWITPQAYEKTDFGSARQGYNETLEAFSAGIKTVADEGGDRFVDQFHPYLDFIDKVRASNPKGRIGGPDAVHPGVEGSTLMAYAILKSLDFPTLVSEVVIDAARNRVIAVRQCEVAKLDASETGVRFERKDFALPFFPPGADSILAWAPVRDELNQYLLRVTGLKSGLYHFAVGGIYANSFTAEQLRVGVNLTASVLRNGPILDHMNKVWGTLLAKNAYYHDNFFRGFIVPGLTLPAAELLARENTLARLESDLLSVLRMEYLPAELKLDGT
jgi:lysophospholipase L1-like esterase